jgi:hypothetical protein
VLPVKSVQMTSDALYPKPSQFRKGRPRVKPIFFSDPQDGGSKWRGPGDGDPQIISRAVFLTSLLMMPRKVSFC